MSFVIKPGERIHTHDGKTHVFDGGQLPAHGLSERPSIRGFIRVGLVDPDGTEHLTDWSENLVTVYGFQSITRAFAGIASSVSSVQNLTSFDSAGMAWARWMAIGFAQTANSANTTAIASTDSCVSIVVGSTGSEYGVNSTGTGGGRIQVSSFQQSLTGTWALVQTVSYASSSLYSGAAASIGAVLNAVAMHYHSSSGSALSIAGFQQVTKLSNQALNLTYSWAFST